MDFPCSIEVLGHFQSLAKLWIFSEFFWTIFLYLKSRHAYQFAGENLQNWIFPAQKALAPKFLDRTVQLKLIVHRSNYMFCVIDTF